SALTISYKFTNSARATAPMRNAVSGETLSGSTWLNSCSRARMAASSCAHQSGLWMSKPSGFMVRLVMTIQRRHPQVGAVADRCLVVLVVPDLLAPDRLVAVEVGHPIANLAELPAGRVIVVRLIWILILIDLLVGELLEHQAGGTDRQVELAP